MMKFAYWRLNNYIENIYSSLLLWVARMEMDLILENLASIFQSSYL